MTKPNRNLQLLRQTETHTQKKIAVHIFILYSNIFGVCISFLLHSGDKKYKGGSAVCAHDPWLLSLVFTSLVASIMFNNNPFATTDTQLFMH